jgi:basic membrane protein A
VSTAVPSASPPRLSLGLVTDIGQLGDRSYNDLAYAGLRREQAQDGATYQVLSSKTRADYIPHLESLTAKHLSLIVAIGFSMGSAVYTVASQHPKQRFVLVDAQPVDSSGNPRTLPNVAAIYFKEQESGYLAGVLAGLMEKDRVGNATHNTVAYMGASPIPPVDRYLAGYVAGIRRVDPSVKIIHAYAGSFTDPTVGQSIAGQQVAQGADILFQVAAATGASYLEQAEKEGKYGIGADVDQSYIGPGIIGSAVKRVDIGVAYVAHRLAQGHFQAGVNLLGLKQGATGVAITSRLVPGSIHRQIRSYSEKIARGSIVPPTVIPPG